MSKIARQAFICKCLLLSSFFLSQTVLADIDGLPNEFYLERAVPTRDLDVLSSNFAGDKISLATGAIEFSVNDINIPLSSDLSVNLSRYYDKLTGVNVKKSLAFGDWGIDLPRIESNYLSGDTRYSNNYTSATACSMLLAPGGVMGALGQSFEPWEFYNGANLIIPGVTKGQVTRYNNSRANYIVNESYLVSCKTDISGNEYFYVEAPSGLKYELKDKSNIAGFSAVKNFKAAGRGKVVYSVSSVTDLAGNKVTYTYDNQKLVNVNFKPVGGASESIMTFQYDSSKRVISVSTTNKTWTYTYSSNNLNRVTLPDNTYWQYSFPEFSEYTPRVLIPTSNYVNYNRDCYYITTLPTNSQLTVKHPNGANLTLDVGLVIHGATDMPAAINGTSTVYNVNACRGSIAVTAKSISGPGLENSTWHYQYSNDGMHWVSTGFTGSTSAARMNTGALLDNEKVTLCSSIAECAAVPSDLGFERFDLRVLKLISPDGSFTKYYISKRFDYTEGQIVGEEVYSKELSLLSRKINKFSKGTARGDNGVYTDITMSNVDAQIYPLRQIQSKIIENSDWYITDYSDFNAYEVPQKEHFYNSVNSYQLYRKTTFLHDTTKWAINLPTAKYLSNTDAYGSAYQELSYHSTLGKPYQQKVFGSLLVTYSYDTKGELWQSTYNGSSRYEKFENYYRGKPQKITLPCAQTDGCNTANGSTSNTIIALQIMNSDGTVQSITDFNGNKTSYNYNPVGWLTKIDYADPKWVDKIISYSAVSTNDDGIAGSGISVGSLRKTISQGNYEKRIYHDGLLRPIFTRERDSANASTVRYQTMAYDHENRQSLSSFPSSDASNRIGMETEYDVLGRIVNQTRTSDGSVSSYEYLAGNKVAVTDGENNTTTTTYLAYGEPSFDKPTLIEAPDSDDITIEYNLFDQVTSIRQGNVTETRLYDAYQQLCKQVRPETGIAAFGYNGQRQQIWRAQGTIGSTTSCDAGAVPAIHKTLLAYDNLGQLRSENFPDSTPDRTYSYDVNGNLSALAAGAVNWSYLYNSQNGLEQESLSLDGKSFMLDWEYNGLGALSSLKYPSGVLVDFAPNGLGQATKAGSYATGVSYHPNGQIKQFTYGNGIVRTVALDSTGRIDLLTDSKSGVLRNKLDPGYDANDNLESLIDWVDRSNDIDNLSYDGVDRLLSADGRWGTGDYSYDGLGNIMSRNLNGSNIGYHYNGLNRLNNLSGAYAYGYQYDARGNVTHNGRYGLAYNLGQQLTAAKGIAYVYDGHNRRVRKTENGTNSYSVYSQGGQLLHRRDADGSQTDSIYLGKTLVAEVYGGTPPPLPPPTSDPLPQVNLSLKTLSSGDECPPKTTCAQVTNGSSRHVLSWSSSYADSCSGLVNKSLNGVNKGTILLTGTSNFGISLAADGTLYSVSLTCTGAGGQTTKQASASGTGTGMEM